MSLPADQSSGGTPQSEVPELLERVKIVHFPVGNGDCTLIMIRGRDTSKARNWHAISFLIDTGSTGNFKKRWDAIWSEIKCGYDNLPEFYKAQAGLKPKLDYFIITHFDQDHANHAGTLLATLKKNRDEEKLDPVRSSSSSEWSWVDYMFIVDRLNGAIAPSDKKNFVNLYRKERAKYDYDEIYGVLPIEPDTDLLRISQTFDLANFEMVCVPGDTSNARFIGTQLEFVAEWTPDREWAFLVSYSQFVPGSFIRDTGPAETIHFFAVEAVFQF